MLQTLFYLLQVIVCSAVMYGYYLLVLRNKRFHNYNRFYLLSILLISWIIPLVRIPLHVVSVVAPQPTMKFFEVVADNNSHLEEYVTYVSANAINWNSVVLWVYGFISCMLFVQFVIAIIKIVLLINRNSSETVGSAKLIYTSAKGAPFSFLHYIFWNKNISLDFVAGKQVLNHEMTHVKEKHSYDKILTSMVIMFGWVNPIFWLVKRELNMVHEFIADKSAVGNNPNELAKILLTVVYPTENFHLANPFFKSPIKRRLSMMKPISLTKNPYLRRLLILPLLATVVLLVSFRKEISKVVGIEKEAATFPKASLDMIAGSSKQQAKEQKQITVDLKKTYTVMIDAGHGGYDGGAVAGDGTREADFDLELANVIRDQNKNEKINLVFTRSYDEYLHPVSRLELIKKKNADVLVSIHASIEDNQKQRGIVLYIPSSDTLSNYKTSYAFANTIANSLTTVQANAPIQIKRRLVGIWIISKAERPAVLIEAGYLSNKTDLQNLKSKGYQIKLANAILQGIELYLQSLEK
jgi:N-acetylmuramoyl-L-alanine amidase